MTTTIWPGAVTTERGNGLPDVGDYVCSVVEGQLYRVTWCGRIETGRAPGCGMTMQARVEAVDWSECVEGDEHRPGGAANVAANVASLGARPTLVSMVGADRGGELIRSELKARGIWRRQAVAADEMALRNRHRILAAWQ